MNALTKFATLTSTFAFAADNSAPRRIVISIPDRKLVLLEGDKPIKLIYSVRTKIAPESRRIRTLS